MRQPNKQTVKLRKKRTEEKRHANELNNIGKRLSWVRTSLKLTLYQVSIMTGIPLATYKCHEKNQRTTYYEEYIVLADYFNGLWNTKFNKTAPIYEGTRVTKITPMFLIFGRYEDESDSLLQDFKQKAFLAQEEENRRASRFQ